MPEYDVPVQGEDPSLVKKNGNLVGCMGPQITVGPLQHGYVDYLQKFIVLLDNEEYMVRGVTPEDALEALRRYSPSLADAVIQDEAMMCRRELVPVINRYSRMVSK